MARGTLCVLCECVRFCNGGRQRSRATWYAHAPYRIGGRYAHLPYEPSAALKVLNTFLTFGNDPDSDSDSDSDDTDDGNGNGNGDGNTHPRLNSPEVDIDNQPGNGNDNEFYGGGDDGLYGGGGGGMGSDAREEPEANEEIQACRSTKGKETRTHHSELSGKRETHRDQRRPLISPPVLSSSCPYGPFDDFCGPRWAASSLRKLLPTYSYLSSTYPREHVGRQLHLRVVENICGLYVGAASHGGSCYPRIGHWPTRSGAQVNSQRTA
ncbi:hypothetical protein MKEN_00465600 [Mycena kentingensis (nom. inval.)]|nr:hypothetical protein MKEN_00465600 [Mycena kentingensis (nom. inval.)]